MTMPMRTTEKRQIPRIIHQICVGTPVPDSVREWMEGWHVMHADWDYRFWTDDNLPPLINRRQYDATAIPAQKADIARYEIVHQHCGVYVDADYECLRRIDALIVNREYLLIRDTVVKRLVQNGRFAAPSGSQLTSRCVGAVGRRFRVSKHPNRTTGPHLITAVANQMRLSVEPLSVLKTIARHYALASWRKPG